MTIFYSLRLEIPPASKARSSYLYPTGTRLPSYILTGTGFPFRRFLRLAGLRWRYSNPPPHGVDTSWPGIIVYIALGWNHRKRCSHRRCIETAVLRLLLAYSLQRECVYRTVAYQWTSALAPLFRLSGVMSQYYFVNISALRIYNTLRTYNFNRKQKRLFRNIVKPLLLEIFKYS
jgi:hypothetical protein